MQVVKGPIGTKGPRITTNISIPGRYLVLMPYNPQRGISRKIEDDRERQRLKKILQRLHIPEGMGVIIRTVGENQKQTLFRPRPGNPPADLETGRRQNQERPDPLLRVPGTRPD